MKKKFEMEDLDCAVCAAKMEDAIKKIEGVEDCSVNFLMQKMTLVAEESEFPRILEEAQKAVSKVDKACKILY